MFVIRQAQLHDLDDLHSLAKQTYFINLPPDREIIASKIEQSQRSFASLVPGRRGAASRASAPRSGAAPRGAEGSGIRTITGDSDLFMLVLEDVEGRGVIGTGQVIARMGGRGQPRVFLTLSTMTRESASLKISWTHQTARLEKDETGPSEIGGLIVNHAFRGHKLRLGRFLSLARFHIVGLFRARFADRVIAEMLGPIDRNGYNPFFEKFTRHFIPRSFAEVYRFSQTSKEFVIGLMPPGEIDLSIMDPEVANSAGAVADETRGARRILEQLGFAYHQRIDPMDGGPHLEAVTEDISLVRKTRRLRSVIAAPQRGRRVPRGTPPTPPNLLVSALDRNGNFRAVQTSGEVRAGGVGAITPDALDLLNPADAVILGAMPLE